MLAVQRQRKRCCGPSRAAIDRYLVPAGPTAANPPQTDRQTDERATVSYTVVYTVCGMQCKTGYKELNYADMLCNSGFIHAVTFARNGPYGVMRIPPQRVTSLCRRAEANTPAASYWLRRVQDDARRRD